LLLVDAVDPLLAEGSSLAAAALSPLLVLLLLLLPAFAWAASALGFTSQPKQLSSTRVSGWS
jgi:hypothetical protein